MSFGSAAIRNVAIAGHGNTGKTTLTEQILFNGGVIPKAEPVETGRTVSDFSPEEIDRKISVHTSFSHITVKDTKINILDTPGSSDFIGEVIVGFRACETVLMLVNADTGVQIETIKLMRNLDGRNKPRVVFINKMDKERADFRKAYDDVKEKFKKTLVPVTIAMGNAEDFKGVINLIENKAYLLHDPAKKDEATDIPAEYREMAEEYRVAMIEAAAEGDDALMEKYFADSTLSQEDILRGLKLGLRGNKLVPVLCGSALKNCGIQSLLDFFVTVLPSPLGFFENGKDQEGNAITQEITPDAPVSCLVVKTSIDQFSGKLSYIKVISGKLLPDTELFNPAHQKKEKIAKIYRCEGKKIEEEKELQAGDIGLLTKVESANTNDTLCSPERIIVYDALKLPQPVHIVAISAVNKKEEDKMTAFLHRATEEDLTFRMSFDPETKETVIKGMGELQINMILEKLRDKQKIEVQTRVPQVAYRETITKPSEAEYTHKKQSGGHGQYGKVLLQIKPLERGEGFKFENAIRGMAVSKGYMPGIEKGVKEAMEEGFLAGYPIVDMAAIVLDGKEHPVDSSEMAFKLAGKGAVKAALEKAGVVLLEPIMTLRVFIEDQYLGDILSDLSGRRGRVLGQQSLGGGIIQVDAEVPQAELLTYAIDLRAMTSGTGSFEMEFNHYSPISGRIAETVINEAKSRMTQAKEE
ncbi:MAG TPA: elongation factor G [Spirochaetia bacterium]|nr:elongation factor G [Spirochaetia bacterium]